MVLLSDSFWPQAALFYTFHALSMYTHMDIHIRYCWPHGINYLPGLLHSIELWQPPQIQILPFR